MKLTLLLFALTFTLAAQPDWTQPLTQGPVTILLYSESVRAPAGQPEIENPNLVAGTIITTNANTNAFRVTLRFMGPSRQVETKEVSVTRLFAYSAFIAPGDIAQLISVTVSEIVDEVIFSIDGR